MNATAYTAPGEGATVYQLYLKLAGSNHLPLKLRGEVCHDLMVMYDLTAKTNLVLLAGRPDGLTNEDLRRIAKVEVGP